MSSGLEHKPVLIPWTSIEEVPLDAWFTQWKTICSKPTDIDIENRELFLYGTWLNLKDLHNHYKYSHDLKTWHPCGKKESK
jgi:hypothetical protein